MFAKWILKLLVTALILLVASPLYAGQKVTIFAAASTTNVVTELLEVYRQEQAPTAEYLTSFASSSTLARQIEAGAEADIYISANIQWFQWLKDKGLIDIGSASILAANSLVLIAAPNNPVTINTIEQLPDVLNDKYLALCDPSHVPAGMYAREALEHFGLWEKLSKKRVFYPTVRMALKAVDTAQADFGIVYRTDALQSRKSRVVMSLAGKSHTPIRYPVGAIKGKNSAEVASFLLFLKTPQAQTILEKHGFAAP